MLLYASQRKMRRARYRPVDDGFHRAHPFVVEIVLTAGTSQRASGIAYQPVKGGRS